MAGDGVREEVLPRPAVGQQTNSTLRYLPAPPSHAPRTAGRVHGVNTVPHAPGVEEASGIHEVPGIDRTKRARKPRRTALLIAAAVAACLALAAVLFTGLLRPGVTGTQPTPSPLMSGPVEEHLRELEESVRP